MDTSWTDYYDMNVNSGTKKKQYLIDHFDQRQIKGLHLETK